MLLNSNLGKLETIYAPLNNVDVSLANPTVDFLVYLTDFRFAIVCATIKQGENYQRVHEIIPVDLIKYAPNTVFSVGKFLNSDYYAIEEFRFPNVHTINYINASYSGFDGIWIDYIFALK